jgi:hypothetical protein
MWDTKYPCQDRKPSVECYWIVPKAGVENDSLAYDQIVVLRAFVQRRKHAVLQYAVQTE